MKKSLFLLGTVAVMLIAMTSVAFAGKTEGTAGIGEWNGTDTVHSGYDTTTNACKVCHDVHNNPGAWKLFISYDVSSGCGACHANGSGGIQVYTSTDVHRLGSAAISIPDATTSGPLDLGVTDELDCIDCHDSAPHGKGTGSVYALATENTSEEDFCLGCHDMNDGRIDGGTLFRTSNSTHVMADLGDAYEEFDGPGNLTADADALASSAKCVNCHVNDVDFPHSGEFKLLATGAASDALDVSCDGCHLGVGTMY